MPDQDAPEQDSSIDDRVIVSTDEGDAPISGTEAPPPLDADALEPSPRTDDVPASEEIDQWEAAGDDSECPARGGDDTGRGVDEMSALVGELAELRGSFERRAEEYERSIRTLHATVEDLQRQQLAGLMKPVFVQFADLHAELSRAAEEARADDEGHAADLDYFARTLEQILDHFDLESVGAAMGLAFDRRSHAAVLTKNTDRPELDQTIARVVRQGFRVVGAERVLIPARVVVWKSVAPVMAPSDDTTDAGAASTAQSEQQSDTGTAGNSDEQ